MLTRQEMFDRAYRGLASQGWRGAVTGLGSEMTCVYKTDDGRRCAWGWVDTGLDDEHSGTVYILRTSGIGLAADLTDDDCEFAVKLQNCHDNADDGEPMHTAFIEFGRRHSLSIPEMP